MTTPGEIAEFQNDEIEMLEGTYGEAFKRLAFVRPTPCSARLRALVGRARAPRPSGSKYPPMQGVPRLVLT